VKLGETSGGDEKDWIQLQSSRATSAWTGSAGSGDPDQNPLTG